MFAAFTARQKRVLAALVLAYSSAYVCRTNISMMLPGIVSGLGITQARAGILATLFAVIYASGQVLNGMIVDRVNPRLWIFTGLMLSAGCNLLCAFVPSFPLLLAIWSLNAIAQSMLWTPVVRVVAQRFEEEEKRSRASFAISFSLVIGNLAAWGAAGLIVSRLGWRQAFMGCAAITGAVGLLTFFMLKGETREQPARKAQPPGAPVRRESGLMKVVFGTGLVMVLAGCLFNGFVRDSIMTWAPTILMHTQGIDLSSVLGTALIIPAVNFLGVLLGRFCYDRMGRRSRRAVAFLTLLSAGFSLLLTLFGTLNALLCAVLLAGCVSMVYGLNPLLTSLLPLEYYGLGRVGTVAGLVDAFIYLGSGLSGFLTGALAERSGWRLVFLIWCVGSLVGAALLHISSGDRFMHWLYEDPQDPEK